MAWRIVLYYYYVVCNCSAFNMPNADLMPFFCRAEETEEEEEPVIRRELHGPRPACGAPRPLGLVIAS